MIFCASKSSSHYACLGIVKKAKFHDFDFSTPIWRYAFLQKNANIDFEFEIYIKNLRTHTLNEAKVPNFNLHLLGDISERNARGQPN